MFHTGEQALQTAAGVRQRLAMATPFIRDHMPEQHRQFFPLLPFVLLGSVDDAGQPWASVLAGPPGFVHSPHARTLDVDAWPYARDPLAGALQPGAPIGLLGLQPHTRRRNRLNGRVTRADGAGFQLRVDQSFGNCPKYIQAHEPRYTGPQAREPRVAALAALDDASRRQLREADTLFIASAHPQARADPDPAQGVDVSHRGGRPGFVRVDGDVLTIPDFSGNFFFNTLGNLMLEPRCGLLLIDHDRGDTLQIAARASFVNDGPELASMHGALRLLRLEVLAAQRSEAALPLAWRPGDLSPYLVNTGTW